MDQNLLLKCYIYDKFMIFGPHSKDLQSICCVSCINSDHLWNKGASYFWQTFHCWSLKILSSANYLKYNKFCMELKKITFSNINSSNCYTILWSFQFRWTFWRLGWKTLHQCTYWNEEALTKSSLISTVSCTTSVKTKYDRSGLAIPYQ